MKISKKAKYNNAKFNRLSKAEKRVEIAKDVIQQIKAHNIIPSSGQWVKFSDKQREQLENNFTPADSLQSLIINNQIEDSCECCGLGALMLSCTLYQNQVSVKDVVEKNAFDFGYKYYTSDYGTLSVDNSKIKTGGLEKIFSKSQMILIELAFEKGRGFMTPITLIQHSAALFAKNLDLKSDTEILLAIMNNIIKNKGTFRPNFP